MKHKKYLIFSSLVSLIMYIFLIIYYIFYWNNLMDNVDHYVFDVMKEKGIDDNYELEDIKSIAGEVMDDEATKNLTVEKIRNYRVREYAI